MMRKVHVISTTIAVPTIFLVTTLFYLSQFDRLLQLDLIPPSWEQGFFLFILVISALAFGASMVSIVLSLFRMAEKN